MGAADDQDNAYDERGGMPLAFGLSRRLGGFVRSFQGLFRHDDHAQEIGEEGGAACEEEDDGDQPDKHAAAGKGRYHWSHSR